MPNRNPNGFLARPCFENYMIPVSAKQYTQGNGLKIQLIEIIENKKGPNWPKRAPSGL